MISNVPKYEVPCVTYEHSLQDPLALKKSLWSIYLTQPLDKCMCVYIYIPRASIAT